MIGHRPATLCAPKPGPHPIEALFEPGERPWWVALRTAPLLFAAIDIPAMALAWLFGAAPSEHESIAAAAVLWGTFVAPVAETVELGMVLCVARKLLVPLNPGVPSLRVMLVSAFLVFGGMHAIPEGLPTHLWGWIVIRWWDAGLSFAAMALLGILYEKRLGIRYAFAGVVLVHMAHNVIVYGVALGLPLFFPS